MNKGLEILIKDFLETDLELKNIQINKKNLLSIIEGMDKRIEELANKEMDIANFVENSGSNICNLVKEYKNEHKHELNLD